MSLGLDILDRDKVLSEQKAARMPLDQELAEWIAPDMADITRAYGIGQKRRQHLFDGSAEHAAQIAAAAMVGLTANQSVAWPRISVLDDEDDLDQDEKEYLETASRVVLNIMNSPDAAFYDIYFMAAKQIVIFGPGSILALEHKKKVVEFSPTHVRDLKIAEAADGSVDTAYRDREWTPKQLLEKEQTDGWVLSKNVKDKAKSTTSALTEKIKCVHALEPNPEIKGEIGVDAMSYRSVYVEKETQNVLYRSGYKEFPMPVGRWAPRRDDPYGGSCGLVALADIKTLNASRKAHMLASELSIKPPLQTHANNQNLPMDFSSGGMSFYKEIQGKVEPVGTVGHLAVSLEIEQQIRMQVREAFFINEFQQPGRQKGNPMTAYEAQVREDYSILQRIPNIQKVITELLSPTVLRVYKIAERAGMLGPIPKRLMGRGLKVSYSTPITRIQRSEENRSIEEMARFATELSGAFPEVKYRFNADYALEAKQNVLSAPTLLLRPKEDADALMKADMETQAAAQQAEIAKTASEAVKNVSGPAVQA